MAGKETVPEEPTRRIRTRGAGLDGAVECGRVRSDTRALVPGNRNRGVQQAPLSGKWCELLSTRTVFRLLQVGRLHSRNQEPGGKLLRFHRHVSWGDRAACGPRCRIGPV